MTAITALTIANNYPENIQISAGYNTDKKGWYGTVYLIRDGEIHRPLISHNSNYQQPFESAEKAEEHLKEICENVVESEKDGSLLGNSKIVLTDQQKIILQAFENSYQNYDDQGKLCQIIEALEKANQNEYLPHTIKSILLEVGFLNKKPQKITESGLKYLLENK